MCEHCDSRREKPWTIPTLEQLRPQYDSEAEALDYQAELEAGLELWHDIVRLNEDGGVPNLFIDGGGTRAIINHLMSGYLMPVVINVLQANAGNRTMAVIDPEISEHLVAILIECFSMGYSYARLEGPELSQRLADRYRKTVDDETEPSPAPTSVAPGETAAPAGEPDWKARLREFMSKDGNQ